MVPGPEYGRATAKNPVYLFLARLLISIYLNYAHITNDSSIQISFVSGARS
jgi:hypothetical protein